eukprot:3935226-Rhodomonas_salina.2
MPAVLIRRTVVPGFEHPCDDQRACGRAGLISHGAKACDLRDSDPVWWYDIAHGCNVRLPDDQLFYGNAFYPASGFYTPTPALRYQPMRALYKARGEKAAPTIVECIAAGNDPGQSTAMRNQTQKPVLVPFVRGLWSPAVDFRVYVPTCISISSQVLKDRVALPGTASWEDQWPVLTLRTVPRVSHVIHGTDLAYGADTRHFRSTPTLQPYWPYSKWPRRRAG